MKNIQVIDAADNCAYDIFQCEDDDFHKIFSDKNIAFIEEIDFSKSPTHNDVSDIMWLRGAGRGA